MNQIVTSFGGYWSSSVDSVNPVKPDSSHLLLAFSYNSALYSTGAGDPTLNKNKVTYKKASFESFQLASNAIQTSASTKIGIGTRIGGYGNVTPVPVTNQLASYLTDGTQGLDLGTAIFNVPGSQMRYRVTNIQANRIGDGIPDVLVTQVGAPPASSVRDTFRFEDSLGNVIGNALPIVMANISIVGTGNWKFYTPGSPCTYDANLQGDRPLRMMAFELSDFGLTAANLSRVARFVHRVSGESDQAFVAYNSNSFTAAVGMVLPVTLKDFGARKAGEQAQLDWSISSASHFSHFEVERAEGGNFEKIGSVSLQSGIAGAFSFRDAQPATGANIYRLKMIDADGSFSYSQSQTLVFASAAGISIYPNPATTSLYIQAESNDATVSLMNVSGAAVPAPVSLEGNRSRIDVSAVPAGFYLVRIQDNSSVQTRRVLINH